MHVSCGLRVDVEWTLSVSKTTGKMNKIYTLLCIMCACVCASAQQQLTAFPGADGFGKFTTGGRGGVVYHVTRLDDCTETDLVEGTLRWALRTGDDTPRTIVFDTCGTIVLSTKLKLQHPNVTIAGQSAPGGGICIAGACIYVCKPNVIIRYIRFRSGDVVDGNYQCLDVENTKNVIIDHCSLTWAVEECLTMYDCDSTTVQWCILGEGLYNAGHKKGQRSYATQWGGEHSSMHHTLITNCYNRTPRFNGVRDEANLAQGKHDHDAQVVSEFSNNVVFNWGKQNSAYGGELVTTKNLDEHGRLLGYDHIYLRNNYYRPGPLTALKISPANMRFVVPSDDNGSWYLDGNRMSDSALAINQNNYRGWGWAPKLDSAYTCLTALQTAEDAYAAVCRGAGASLPRYDEEDTRLLAEVAGTVEPQFVGSVETTWLGIIDSQKDITFLRPDTFVYAGDTVTSYPYIGLQEGETLLPDSDRDGMPDAWELAHSLNPADPTDGNATTLSSLAGYTNLEYYLNGGEGEMADPIPNAPEIPVVPEWVGLDNNPVSGSGARIRWQNGLLFVEKNGELYTLTGQKIQ